MARRMLTATGIAVAAIALAGCGGSPHTAVITPRSAPRRSVVARPVAQPMADPAPTPGAAANRTITVSGTGRVVATPDTATITLGVQSRASSAVDALAQAADRAGKVIDVLKGAGVAARDIQTAGLSLQPIYDDGGRQLIAYEASNSVTAKVHDLGRAGRIVDAVVGVVGNDIRFEGVGFSIDDPTKLAEAARTDAVKRAAGQAQQLAAAAGVALGDVVSISESTTYPGPPILAQDGVASKAAGPAAAPTPIEPGSQELTVQVTVAFAIR